MAIEYGITDEGFVRKSLTIIRQEIESDLKSTFGEQINTSSESILGQLRDIFADRLNYMWELFELTYNSQYPNTAEGVSLENIGDINALEYIEAAASVIQNQRFLGTATTVIPAGTQVSVDGDTSTIFETDEALTLVAGTDGIQTITFSAVPDEGGFTVSYENDETASIAYDDTAADVQAALRALTNLTEVTVSGDFSTGFTITFAGIDGKQEQPILAEETNTLKESSVAVAITITETVSGVNQGVVDMTCTETGPTSANARTVTNIMNPISGVSSTINVTDAILGRERETDAEFRIRRRIRLTTSEAGTLEAIMNKIWSLNDDQYSELVQLQNVNAYENSGDSIDSRNLPPHSVMAVIRQTGDAMTRDQEIAQMIFNSKPAGIQTSFGNDVHAIEFVGTPSGGTWTLTYSGQTTSALAHTASNTDVQNALNALSNLSGTVVTGSMSEGFEVEYDGDNSTVIMELLTGDISSLTGVTDILIDRDFNKVTKTVNDSTSVPHTINFARPVEVPIYLILDDFTTNDEYPSDGDTQLKAVLVEWGNDLGTGVDVIVYPQLIAQIATIPGITDFDVKIGTAPGPTLDDNVTISDGTSTNPEFSSWDTTNITIIDA